jgi:hypothetical protein
MFLLVHLQNITQMNFKFQTNTQIIYFYINLNKMVNIDYFFET